MPEVDYYLLSSLKPRAVFSAGVSGLPVAGFDGRSTAFCAHKYSLMVCGAVSEPQGRTIVVGTSIVEVYIDLRTTATGHKLSNVD